LQHFSNDEERKKSNQRWRQTRRRRSGTVDPLTLPIRHRKNQHSIVLIETFTKHSDVDLYSFVGTTISDQLLQQPQQHQRAQPPLPPHYIYWVKPHLYTKFTNRLQQYTLKVKEALVAVNEMVVLLAPLTNMDDDGEFETTRGRCTLAKTTLKKYQYWLQLLTKHQQKDTKPPPPRRRRKQRIQQQNNKTKKKKQLGEKRKHSNSDLSQPMEQQHFRRQQYEKNKQKTPTQFNNNDADVQRKKRKPDPGLFVERNDAKMGNEGNEKEKEEEEEEEEVVPAAEQFRWRVLPDPHAFKQHISVLPTFAVVLYALL
jgi:hypothetical protein